MTLEPLSAPNGIFTLTDGVSTGVEFNWKALRAVAGDEVATLEDEVCSADPIVRESDLVVVTVACGWRMFRPKCSWGAVAIASRFARLGSKRWKCRAGNSS